MVEYEIEVECDPGCGFVGTTPVRFHRGLRDWDCPECGMHHEGDIE